MLARAAAALMIFVCAAARGAEPAPERLKGEIAVGGIFPIKLPCTPTTGYAWAVKSIDRKIAVPAGPVEFRKNPAPAGAAGVGGYCVIGIKGVKAGKTTSVLVYRRPWEKAEPLKTVEADITVKRP